MAFTFCVLILQIFIIDLITWYCRSTLATYRATEISNIVIALIIQSYTSWSILADLFKKCLLLKLLLLTP